MLALANVRKLKKVCVRSQSEQYISLITMQTRFTLQNFVSESNDFRKKSSPLFKSEPIFS